MSIHVIDQLFERHYPNSFQKKHAFTHSLRVWKFVEKHHKHHHFHGWMFVF